MSAVEVIARHLTALGLRYRTTGDGVILIAFSGDNTPYEAAIQSRGPIVSVVAPTVSMIPRPRLEEAIRVANLLNARKVQFGSFWVDPGRRRVAFEVTIAASDAPTREQVDLAMAALSQIDDCFPILAAVIWGDMTAEAALSSARLDHQDEDPPALDLAV